MRILLFIMSYFIFGDLTSQNFTYSGTIYNADETGANNLPVKLYKRSVNTSGNNSTSVKVYRTHFGTGNTSQYQAYPSTRTEMDRCFNTSYSATNLWWSGTMSGNVSLNFGQYTSLTSAGATVPTSGEYYAVEVTFTFTPQETGSYSFGITSDDGSDLLLVNTGNIVEWYGGKGYGVYRYGSVNLTKGNSYTFIARMQEYGGGDGLYLVWRRPSQTTHSYQSSEIGTQSTTTTAWVLESTSNTNSNGYYSFNRTSDPSKQYYIEVVSPTPVTSLNNSDGLIIGDYVLKNKSANGIIFQTYDLNNDGKLTVSDQFLLFAKKSGLKSTWGSLPTSRLFIKSEFDSLKLATSNLRNTYSGVATYTSSTLTSGGSLNLYLIATGYYKQVTY